MAKLYRASNDIRAPINTSLWRYMSLSKLLYMLQSQRLWFSRVDKLVDADPFEGSVPRNSINLEVLNRLSLRNRYLLNSEKLVSQVPEKKIEAVLDLWRTERARTYVSCWHASRSDSDAMWRSYGADKDGSVCVQTTTARVVQHLPYWVFCGRINYVDYASKSPDLIDALSPFYYKRTCFAHESEVRLAVNPTFRPMDMDWNQEAAGIGVPFDPEKLFLKICVSPTSQSWFLETVEAAVKHLGIGIPIEVAPMSALPNF